MEVKKSIRRSSAEITTILANLAESGLSVRAFAAREGLPKNSIYTWVKKAKPKSSSAAGIVAVAKVPRAKTPSARSANPNIISIMFEGLTIQLPANTTAEQWKALKEGLLQS